MRAFTVNKKHERTRQMHKTNVDPHLVATMEQIEHEGLDIRDSVKLLQTLGYFSPGECAGASIARFTIGAVAKVFAEATVAEAFPREVWNRSTEEVVDLSRRFYLAPEHAIRDAVIWAYKDGLGNPQPSTQDDANRPVRRETDPPAEEIRDFTIVHALKHIKDAGFDPEKAAMYLENEGYYSLLSPDGGTSLTAFSRLAANVVATALTNGRLASYLDARQRTELQDTEIAIMRKLFTDPITGISEAFALRFKGMLEDI